MKMPRPISIVVLAATTSVIVATSVKGETQMVPPKEADAIGVWSGYSNHGEFIRLELDRNNGGYISIGTGVGAPDQDSPDTYTLSNWRLSNFAITWETRPLTGKAERVTFDRVRCYYTSIECEFHGTNWNRKVTLFNDRDWQTHTKKAKAAIARERKRSR